MTANQVTSPHALVDMYPIDAQQLYIDTCKQSLGNSAGETRDHLSRESVAAYDAWDAVYREFTQEQVTHHGRHGSDTSITESKQTGKHSLVDTVKGIFKH